MNNKVSTLFCIVLSLMLVVSCAFAEEWFCPECGKSNTGNFCYNCGQKRPEEKDSETGISNVQCNLQDNGDVVVSWDDSSSSPPYIVTYKAQFDNAELDPVNSKRISLEFLIPSETYTITVSNGKSSASTQFLVPVKVYTEFSSAKKKIILTNSNLSISEVYREKTMQNELQVHYPQLRKNRSYKAKLVTKTPDGYGGLVWVFEKFDLENEYSYIYTGFSMYEFFEGIKKDFTEIPTGPYSFELYFDGQLYSSCTFNIVP